VGIVSISARGIITVTVQQSDVFFFILVLRSDGYLIIMTIELILTIERERLDLHDISVLNGRHPF